MSSASPGRLLTLAFAAALAALAGGIFLHGQPAGLPVDDAYIHLVYAQNLAQGRGLCFNLGEPSLGTSSPLWVFLIRALLPGFAPEAAVRALAPSMKIPGQFTSTRRTEGKRQPSATILNGPSPISGDTSETNFLPSGLTKLAAFAKLECAR